MSEKLHLERVGLVFVSFYALLFMSNAVFGTFFSVYLQSVGYTTTAIGSLLALGPFVTLIAQPIWGMAGDRAKVKNNVLMILALGTAITALLFRISYNYYYLIAIVAVSTFFRSSISPISDTITLEYLEKSRWKFSTIRMSGTIGYALMSIVAGYFAKRNIDAIFIIYFFIASLIFVIIFYMPKVKGHQSDGKKVSILALFKNYELMLMIGYAMVIQLTVGFFHSFFPIFLKGMGGDNGLLGWAMFTSALFEIPFLLFANKIIHRIGTRNTLIGSGIVTAVRWLLLYFITDPVWVLPLQVLHGLSFIVVSYSMITYINEKVPKELKASGQSLFGLMSMGISSIIANLLGGYISDKFGIRQVFLYNGCLIIAAIIIFTFLYQLGAKAKLKQTATAEI